MLQFNLEIFSGINPDNHYKLLFNLKFQTE